MTITGRINISGTKGGDDTVAGNKGDDVLIGDTQGLSKGAKESGGGNDTLRGGKNDDRFIAGPGKDLCAGSDGADKDLSQPKCESTSQIP